MIGAVRIQLERQGFHFTDRQLGEGGFGAVEVAVFGGIERAVKVSKEPIEASVHVEKELERLEYIKQLTQHRSIVGLILYQTVEVQERNRTRRYLVTVWELADASLADRRDSISRDQLLDYLQDTAEALDYLHGEGIHHRDVKPHNILIFDGDGHARLGDLGLARMVEQTATATRVVSLGFTPPEILTSGRSYPTSDLFSLACTYLWMRTGSFPGELFVEDADGRERIDGVSPEENEVLLEALAPDHNERPAEGIVRWVERLRQCCGDAHRSRGGDAAEDGSSSSEPSVTQPRSGSDSVEALRPPPKVDSSNFPPRNRTSIVLLGTGFVCVVTILILLVPSMPGFRQPHRVSDESLDSDQDPMSAEHFAHLFLDREPSNPQSVLAVRAEAKDGEEVVVVGRIGGASNPWVASVAFLLVDLSLTPCNEIPGDLCPTPWDYCATDPEKLSGATALVQLVDGGEPIGLEAASELLRELLLVKDVKELQTVIVQGTAQRDELSNLTIRASGVYVRR